MGRLTSAHWRERADQTRALAAGMDDDDVRRALPNLVKDYDKLAERAERLDRSEQG